MSHFEERLEADLKHIRQWVWDMGEEVQQALLNAKKALMSRDEDLAYATVLGDNPINRKSRACDRLCHTFIARHLPGAGHLREMAATIRVNVALERIGDYAVTISRESLQLQQDLPENFVIQIDRLADEAFQILHESRVSFRDSNAELARNLMQIAKQVEGKMDSIYDSLFAENDGLNARAALAIFVAFNMLKRVADQAKNICDQTFYAVRGVAKIPKIYRILFLAPQDSALGQLAVAIGRKSFPSAATFDSATPKAAMPVSVQLQAFLAETGLPDENLETTKLELLTHDLSGFDVIITLQGRVGGYTTNVPFHTTALNWSLPVAAAGTDFSSEYRELRSQISA
ncbi:MAG: PhoU domain-containing protein, partial [Lysobacterales bacterium]